MDLPHEETKDKIIKKKRNHIINRIKKRLGIVGRDSNICSSQNNLPPLQFHMVHGDNIRISRDGALARRYESFCRALTFSARPIRINERICMRFSEVSNNWNGGIRFGLTSNDPVSLKNNLPKYACPDLTNRPGFWAKALHEQYCALDNVLFYYVNSVGDVTYGINGEEKGIILSGIDVRGLLWAVIDIYGNCNAIELLDARLLNQHSPTNVLPHQTSHSNLSINSNNCIVTPLQSLSIGETEDNVPHLLYNKGNLLAPFPLHTTKGRNIKLSQDYMIATRKDTDICQGYVFTSRPIRTDETMIIQILKMDHSYEGSLALGLTSCNPAFLSEYDLPNDSNFLLDRPEYWVVNKDIPFACDYRDEISLCISSIGELTISKNCGVPVVLMHVDHRLQLWAFLDVYGSTKSIRMFRQVSQNAANTRLPAHISSTDSFNTLRSNSSSSLVPIDSSSASVNLSQLLHSSQLLHRIESPGETETITSNLSIPKHGPILTPSTSDIIQVQPGGTILVVNLPPSTSHGQGMDSEGRGLINPDYITSTYLSASKLSKKQEKSFETNSSMGSKSSIAITNSKFVEKHNEKDLTVSECTICYEKNIDSVLYMCGHMCMCYECAIQQWRGAGGGQCPLCRAVIRDVIRTYTS